MSDTHDDQPLPHPGDREPAEGGRDEVDEQPGRTGAESAGGGSADEHDDDEAGG